jgi:hypothetical protein
MLTDQDREDWYFNPVTKEFLANLEATRLETMEAWAAGQFVSGEPTVTLQYNATALGGIKLLDQLIELIASYKPKEATSE